MEKEFDIDVVVTTYQLTSELLKAIESVLAQTYQVNQIIVVDDGSNHDVVKYLKEHIVPILNVRVIFNSHTSLPSAGRLIGIKESSAPWIAFLDGDDWWEPEKISIQMRYAQLTGAQIVSTNATVWKDDKPLGVLLHQVPRILNFRQLIKQNYVVNSSIIVKKSLLSLIGTYAESAQVRTVEDYATWLRIASLENIHFLDCDLVNYLEANSSIRKSNLHNPRPHALVDFLSWLSRTNLFNILTRIVIRYRVLKELGGLHD